MLLKNLKISKQTVHKFLNSLFCLTCIFYINLSGCKSDSIHAKIKMRLENAKQQTINMKSEGFAFKRTKRSHTKNESFINTNNPKIPAIYPVSQTIRENKKVSENNLIPVTDSRKNTLSSTKMQVQSSRELSAQSEKPVAAAENLFLKENPQPVNMPLLNNPQMADELIAVNFEQADIRTVIKTVGDIMGINFVVDDSVKGTVTLMSPTRIRLDNLYKVLESILEVQGYAAVPGEDLVKIVPRADAVKRNLLVRVGSNPADIPLSDSIVTQIIPLSYADAAEVSQIIQPLLAAGAQMATYPRTNSIVITDTCSNIHHIAKIIQNLDVTGSKEQVTVFSLEHASAEVLSEQITRIMEKQKSTSIQAARLRNMPQITSDIKIMPDTRTNSLIVVATAQDTETIRELIIQLDIQRPTGTNNVHVVYLQHAQADEVAESLTAALSNLKIAGALEATQQVQVTADIGTNSLIIAASSQDFEVISEIIEKLDIVREQVFVEMLIMEVSEDTLQQIGVDWATIDQSVEGSARFFGATNFGPRVDFASGTLEGLAVGLWRGTGSNLRIGTMVHALRTQTGVNILSTPHILTSNHHKASIIVGESRPFVTQSKITEGDPLTPTVVKTYEYKDVGITMEITPHISKGGLIRLEINSEFTKLIEDVTSNSVDTPSTAKRQAETVVSMNSGSTVVIGGLIRDDKTTIKKKVPLVGDIPLIGGLFRFDKEQLQKTNLLIFITPHIMGNQEDMEQITEEKRQIIEQVTEDFKIKNGKN
jgi:general secretion pathway protein D